MTRQVPTLYAGVTTATTTSLDADFAALVPGSVLPCTATGSNAIALTPVSATLSVSAYSDKEQYAFNAPASSTGSVTINVSSVGALPLYKAGGSVQAASGDLTSGQFLQVAYQSALNAAAGGFVIVNGVAASAATIPRSYLAGMTLSNDGSTPNSVLDVSAGQATDSTNAVTITLTAFTKSTAGAWASGSGSNGMGQGLTIASTTWYHVFAIVNSGSADAYFDTSVSAANKPASTTAFRRIGSFLTDGSAHIVLFLQRGDLFFWKGVPALDVNGTAMTLNVAQSFTLANVPTGVVVEASVNLQMISGTNPAIIYAYSPDCSDPASLATNTTPLGSILESISANVINFAGARVPVVTNTTAQIRVMINQTQSLYAVATGWRDFLGRYT